MANNIGYLTSSKTPEHQELYTPYYAVEPIVKYIPKSYRIWCPFDAEWSSFYQTFRENGFDVIRSHIDEGKDFFLYEPDDYDVIISNPPFNIVYDLSNCPIPDYPNCLETAQSCVHNSSF